MGAIKSVMKRVSNQTGKPSNLFSLVGKKSKNTHSIVLNNGAETPKQ
jgi:hypothetical protein